MNKLKNITTVAKKLNLKSNDLYCYGKYMAKIQKSKFDNKNGKLILVTSINPTPYGEGKTTLSIGLNDSLNKLGKNSVVTLREPSLGPVFGKKGGAVGGGLAKVVPEDDINMHFTGDFHAITSANNLLCAIIDNHIFQGNDLKIDKVVFKRCLDINDRALRNIKLKDRDENFVITPASEIMAILCLSNNIDELKNMISNIIVGYTKDKKEIYAKDLHAENALTILLKDAIKPNLVQTLYNNPAIIHGGPFANIAHGCSSIISTKMGLQLSDYVITECGFGSDMGAIKFFDIKSRRANIYPDVVIINSTVRALKYHGNGDIKKGISNLEYHINNMKKFSKNIIVTLNKFDDDTISDIDFISKFCLSKDISFSICTMYECGENGCIDLAKKVIDLSKRKQNPYFIYDLNDSLKTKIKKVCSLFGCKNIIYTDDVIDKIKYIDKKYKGYEICIAKTPMSITDDKNVLGYPKNFTMKVIDIAVYNGAKFIVVYMGKVLTMPGLSKDSNYLKM